MFTRFASGFALWLALAATASASVTYTYDAAGRLTGVNYGNGVIIGYTYDRAGNLLSRLVTTPCDVSRTGSTTVADVQTIINEALGVTPPMNDLNGDRAVNVVDVQIVVKAALGQTCFAH